MNMKDLLPKTFTCFKRVNMEIYDSITYVEPFSLPGVQNRKRYWNVTLAIWFGELSAIIAHVGVVGIQRSLLLNVC